MDAEQIEARKRATFGRTSTGQLIQSLRQMGGIDRAQPSSENKMVISWIRDELETRCPQASQAVEDAFFAAEIEQEATGQYVEVDYDAVLIAAIEQI